MFGIPVGVIMGFMPVARQVLAWGVALAELAHSKGETTAEELAKTKADLDTSSENFRAEVAKAKAEIAARDSAGG